MCTVDEEIPLPRFRHMLRLPLLLALCRRRNNVFVLHSSLLCKGNYVLIHHHILGKQKIIQFEPYFSAIERLTNFRPAYFLSE